jgi:RNA polymerase sigma-70 factor (ECF subfamily)
MLATDVHLLEQWARDRNAEAFRELVNRHAGMVYATARRILGEVARAEDVAQDCFLKLAVMPKATSNLPAWLHRVATNRALNLLRAERRRRENESRWIRPESAPPDAGWEEIKALVDDAIDRLPDHLRTPIVLHFLENRTHDAVASTLGISKATVAYRISMGITKIRVSLKKRGIGVAPALLAGWLTTRTAEAIPEVLIALLGKMALAGPDAVMAREVGGVRGNSVRSPGGGSLPFALAGGLMKVYLPIGAGLLILATCLFLVLQYHNNEEPRLEVAASQTSGTTEKAGRPAEVFPGPPVPAEGAKEPTLPAAEEKKEPLASVSGSVLDEKDAPIPFAEVLLTFHPHPSEPGDSLPFDSLNKDAIRYSRSLSTTADESGDYRFDEVPLSGKAILSAFQEGFTGDGEEVEVEAGKPLEGENLRLSPGKTLRGIVSGSDGRTVPDAIVTVTQAWNPQERVWDFGMTATDEDGSFGVGLSAKAEFCHLRVNSESLGQDFFFDVPVTGEEVHLRMKEGAILRGRITWYDGSPAKDVLVYLSTGGGPEPKVAIRDSGLRRIYRTEASLDADGRYEIRDLQPGFGYEAKVIEGGPDKAKAHRYPLIPGKHLSFSPGEVKRWDESITQPIVVRGTVRTELSETPLEKAPISLRRLDGEDVGGSNAESNAEGSFRLQINTGPGRYFVYAVPPLAAHWEGIADPIAERFGKTLDLKGGDEFEVDLQVFEPIVLPVRVLDSGGKPVEAINFSLGFQTLNGRNYGSGDWRRLDDGGRTSFKLHFPVKELNLQVGAFPAGPPSEVRHFQSEMGTILPEETFVLERTCDLSGMLLDPAGKPLDEKSITVDATYGDGKSDSFNVPTDRNGNFSVKGRIRATAVTLRIHGEEGAWKSQTLDGAAGALDLGRIVLEPENPSGED